MTVRFYLSFFVCEFFQIKAKVLHFLVCEDYTRLHNGSRKGALGLLLLFLAHCCKGGYADLGSIAASNILSGFTITADAQGKKCLPENQVWIMSSTCLRAVQVRREVSKTPVRSTCRFFFLFGLSQVNMQAGIFLAHLQHLKWL